MTMMSTQLINYKSDIDMELTNMANKEDLKGMNNKQDIVNMPNEMASKEDL